MAPVHLYAGIIPGRLQHLYVSVSTGGDNIYLYTTESVYLLNYRNPKRLGLTIRQTMHYEIVSYSKPLCHSMIS